MYAVPLDFWILQARSQHCQEHRHSTANSSENDIHIDINRVSAFIITFVSFINFVLFDKYTWPKASVMQ